MAGELKDPGRTIPLVMNISMVVAILLFLLTNISYLTTLPFESVVASTSIGLVSVDPNLSLDVFSMFKCTRG